MTKGPILIDLEDGARAPNPADAPPVPEPATPATPDGRAMRTAATLAARRPSRLARLFWGLLLTLLGAAISMAAWDFVARLFERAMLLGYVATGLIAAFVLVCLVICLRELAALSRLARIDRLRREADAALAENDLARTREVVASLTRHFEGREDMRWGLDRLKSYGGDQFDAVGLLGLAETELVIPLDLSAQREIEAAARQVAAITAIVPLAFADVFAALAANLRMIRRVAEIYGARAGVVGGLRLARAVMAHLVATGAVAVGDDMLGSLAGGGVISRLSRRFGEGLINGALTARVGVAAIEVCRPLPFVAARRPSVTSVVRRALAGLFAHG